LYINKGYTTYVILILYRHAAVATDMFPIRAA